MHGMADNSAVPFLYIGNRYDNINTIIKTNSFNY